MVEAVNYSDKIKKGYRIQAKNLKGSHNSGVALFRRVKGFAYSADILS